MSREKNVEKKIALFIAFTLIILTILAFHTPNPELGTPNNDSFTCPDNMTVLESNFPTSANSKTCIPLDNGSSNLSQPTNESELNG